MDHIRRALKSAEGSFQVSKEQGRIYVFPQGEYDYEETVEILQRVFGIAAICPVVMAEDRGYEQLAADVVQYIRGSVSGLQGNL